MTGPFAPGVVLHGGFVVPTVEEYLMHSLKEALRAIDLDSRGELTNSNGTPRKLTRAAWAELNGKACALADAILAVRSGSGYFVDRRQHVIDAARAELRAELESSRNSPD